MKLDVQPTSAEKPTQGVILSDWAIKKLYFQIFCQRVQQARSERAANNNKQ